MAMLTFQRFRYDTHFAGLYHQARFRDQLGLKKFLTGKFVDGGGGDQITVCRTEMQCGLPMAVFAFHRILRLFEFRLNKCEISLPAAAASLVGTFGI